MVEDGVTGCLVPPRDHTAMARAIVGLLKDDPMRRRMGEAGFARAAFRLRRVGAQENVTSVLFEPERGNGFLQCRAVHQRGASVAGIHPMATIEFYCCRRIGELIGGFPSKPDD